MQSVNSNHRYKDILQQTEAFLNLSEEIDGGGSNYKRKVEYVAKAFFAIVTFPIRFFINGVVSFIKSLDSMINGKKNSFGNMLLESAVRVIHAVMFAPMVISGLFSNKSLRVMVDWVKDSDGEGYRSSKKKLERIEVGSNQSNKLSKYDNKEATRDGRLEQQLGVYLQLQLTKGGNVQTQTGEDEEKNKVKLEDLSAKVAEFTPAVGRKKLIREMVEILNLPEQKNIILTGKTGVGKTTVIHGLVKFLEEHKHNAGIPERLRGVKVLSFSASSLVSGTKYRGSLQEKFEKLIEEVKGSKVPVILFVDEIHQLMGAGGVESDNGANSVDQLLLTHLTGKNITVIGATTPEEFEKYINPQKAFLRRFIKKEVEPLKDKYILDALINHTNKLMDDYNVTIDPNLSKVALQLSEELVFEEKNLKLDFAKKILSLAASKAQLKILYSEKKERVDDLTEKMLEKVAKAMKNSEKESWRAMYN
jgi:ATP-dependent Clp protease ATP-binding subunit ClpA